MTRLAQLDFEERGNVVVARLSGELDLSNVHDIGDGIASAVTAQATGLVLDLTGLTHLDSAGVRLMFDLRQRLVATVPRDAPIREILDLAAVPATVPIYDHVDQAVRAAAASA